VQRDQLVLDRLAVGRQQILRLLLIRLQLIL